MSTGTWQFTLVGLGVGLLVGMTGMGGGSLMTPILILLFGFDPGKAVGTDLVHGAVFKSFGAVRHRTLGTVHARLALWMFAGSAPLSLLGNWVGNQLGKHSLDLQSRVIGWALILGGLGFLAKTFLRRGVQVSDAPFILVRRDKIIALALGASGGFIVGMTSVGSGTFFGLVMLFAYPLTAAKLVGTDIFHAAALLWVAGAGSVLHGNVVWHAFAWMLIGSIPGVLMGSRLPLLIPDRVLRVSFGAVLILSGIKLIEVLSKNATNWTIAGGLALFAIGMVAWAVVHVTRTRELRARLAAEAPPRPVEHTP
ncbi:MAG: uncharacterized protein QOE29_1360 [Gaiellaceae bacterium]|nr:uncharacterized protein [Gaiellaceae bacterium]